MNLLLLVCCSVVIIGCYGSPIETHFGINKCSRGEAYWCNSITSSIKCNATVHCLQTVWAKQVFDKAADNEVCTICKSMVTEIRSTFMIQDITVEDIFKVCSVLTPGDLRDKCNAASATFLPGLMKVLLSSMEPENVCIVANLCNNKVINDMIEDENSANADEIESTETISKEGLNKPFNCLICKFAFHNLRLYLNRTSNRRNILKYVKHNICHNMPEIIIETCLVNIRVFGKILLNLLVPFIDPKLCKYISECVVSSPIKEFNDVDLNLLNDYAKKTSCFLCMYNTGVFIKTLYNAKKILYKFFNTTCHILPYPLQPDCIKFVKKSFVPKLFNILSKLSNKLICKQLKFCNIWNNALLLSDIATAYNLCSQNFEEIQQQINHPQLKAFLRQTRTICTQIFRLSHTVGDFEDPQNVEEEDLYEISLSSDNNSLMPTGIFCGLCSKVVAAIKQHSGNKLVRKIIVHVLKMGCRFLHVFSILCHIFLKIFGDRVVKLIMEHLSKEGICKRLRVCGSMPNPLLISANDIDGFKYLTHNTFNSVFDGSIDSTSIIDYQKNIDSFEFDDEYMMMPAGRRCDLCKKVVGSIESAIGHRRTRDAVKAALRFACNNLPGWIQGLCKKFVNRFSNALIDLIVSVYNPDGVCSRLRACVSFTENNLIGDPTNFKDPTNFEDPTSFEDPTNFIDPTNFEDPTDFDDFSLSDPTGVVVASNGDILVTNPKLSDATFCSLCVMVVRKLESILQDRNNRGEVAALLKNICVYFGSKKKSCEDLIAHYTSPLIRFIIEIYSPNGVCTAAMVCLNVKVNNPFELYGPKMSYSQIDYDPQSDENDSAEEFDNSVQHFLGRSENDVEFSSFCSICKNIVKKIEQHLEGKQTKTDIKESLKYGCNGLMLFKNRCLQFMEMNSDKIVGIYMRTRSLKTICNELGMCAEIIDDFSSDAVKYW